MCEGVLSRIIFLDFLLDSILVFIVVILHTKSFLSIYIINNENDNDINESIYMNINESIYIRLGKTMVLLKIPVGVNCIKEIY